MKKLILAILMAQTVWAGTAQSTALVLKDLVCEYHTNPIGIDVAKPRLSWKIVSNEENVLQTAYEIRVTDQSPKGKLLWTSGKVASDQSVNVEYGGPALKSMQRVYWQVRVWDNKGKASAWSEPAFWELGLLKPEEWKAQWIENPSETDREGSKPCNYFRKEFSATKTVKSARIYSTCHGLYELYLNGQKVSADLFAPGYTAYKKRLQYQIYDVTSLIKPKNAIGAIVGDGWYRGHVTGWRFTNYYGSMLGLLAQIQINYTDGTSELVCTDGSWKVTNNGPIRESDMFDGETYDARMDMPGWANRGFDESAWQKTIVAEYPKNILVAPQGEVVKAIEEIKPIKLFTTPKGEKVFDLGQNITGWARLKVQGNKGDTVVLKFAEMLDKEGNFFTANLEHAKVTDTYILKGEGTEVFEPHFTFHGFRYISIEGISGEPAPDQVSGVVVHSDIKPTGSFSCSNPLINQLQQNIQWSQRDNSLDIPTDSPQRGERQGWTGDAQVFGATAAFNFNVAPFFTKWLLDLAADQLPNGSVPSVVPYAQHPVYLRLYGCAAWGDAATVIPWDMYLAYGDKRILEVQYPSMKAWVEYMKSQAGEDLIWNGPFSYKTMNYQYGDHLAFAPLDPCDFPGATTSRDIITTSYFAYSTSLLAKMAAVIGNKEDAAKYSQLSEAIKKAFQKEFLTPGGRLASQSQTAYSMALEFGLLPEDLVPKAAANLAEDVKIMGHLTTGYVGTSLLCKALSDNGYADLAFTLLNNEEYPSWLYMVKKGATTLWERWNAVRPDGTVERSSFNHYALGSVGEWMYQYIAGINIDPENPGYKHILLSPHPGGGLTHAEAELKTMYGKVKSAWKLEAGEMVYEVTVPANTTATITLPGAKAGEVMMNGKLVAGTSVELGSGSYVFRYPVKPGMN